MTPSHAQQTIRVATFETELARKGPGLLLRDILKGKDPQINAVIDVITHNNPDILVLTGFDFDLGQVALQAFAKVLNDGGSTYPHVFSLKPNTGEPTGLDLDQNGKLGEPRDMQGYGRFAGQSGMAVLSKFPILTDRVQDFSDMLWIDLPGHKLPQLDGVAFYPPTVTDVLKLAETGHWVVPVQPLAGPPIDLLMFAATTPVFDGPEDRNGTRNADQMRFWIQYLDGRMFNRDISRPVVLIGKANVDPNAGAGLRYVMNDLLNHPAVQDPLPSRPTVAFRPPPNGPGDLRVDYVLPDARFTVRDAGVDWPGSNDPRLPDIQTASRHRLVWTDLVLDR